MNNEIKALKEIEQMNHGDSYEISFFKMKSIATEAIKKFEDSSGKETGIVEQMNYSDKELQRLYEWVMDENRKKAETFFTSGWLRNVAREIEYRLKSFKDDKFWQEVEDFLFTTEDVSIDSPEELSRILKSHFQSVSPYKEEEKEAENEKQKTNYPQIHLSATDANTVEEATQLVLHKMGDGTLFVEVYHNNEFKEKFQFPHYQFTISKVAFDKMKTFVLLSTNYDNFKGVEEVEKDIKEVNDGAKTDTSKLHDTFNHPYKEEVDKEDELWDEVMQEMGFYSSQLDNIKSKFILIRKI